MKNNNERGTFSDKLGFVLAAAGASVGLGNIWRFPYLAARYGGGIFLLVYLILAVTFGYTMIMSECTLGRMTKKSPVGAFGAFGKTPFLKFGGWINSISPMLIVSYYAVIGGWVCKYLFEYLIADPSVPAADDYFTSFITSAGPEYFWFLVFAAATMVIIYLGVENGIERVSRIMMPVLVILAIVIAVYSITRPGALEGVKYVLIPDFSRFSWMTVVAALEQMFFSLSIAMGIQYTYGSYMKKDLDIEDSTFQVEIFDTGIAIVAALIVIPAVFAFSGGDPSVLNAGPSLVFITLPKVFESMAIGKFIGILFFLLVFFAALTSAIALAESFVATLVDEFAMSRAKAVLFASVFILVLGSLTVFGYNLLGWVRIFGMEILDFLDFITNSIFMPIAAICTCVLILKVAGIAAVSEEIESSSPFRLKKVYCFVLKYLAIAFIAIILISSVASVLGLLSL